MKKTEVRRLLEGKKRKNDETQHNKMMTMLLIRWAFVVAVAVVVVDVVVWHCFILPLVFMHSTAIQES